MQRPFSPKVTKKKAVQAAVLLIVLAGCIIFGVSEQTASEVLGNSFVNLYKNNQTLVAGTYRVVQVDDGDTLVVDMNGTEEKIRLIGVDTPETKDPRKPVQCFGHAATQFTKEYIGDNPVRLGADPLNTNRDRYNRLLRYAYLPDGTLLNAELIKQGYGFAYVGFPFEKADEFKRYEQEARETNKGLWNDCQPSINQHGGYDSNPT